MRLLILGGTGFVGRHLVAAALARGHDLTLFDRGLTGPGLFPDLERLAGDREADLAPAVTGRSWDAVVDASGFTPAMVATSAEALADRAGHYVFVSSVSAYADLSAHGIDEEAPLAPDGDTYGARKAESERLLEGSWPGPLLRLRPGLLVGPHDTSGRFGYWVRRVAVGGDVLVPGPPRRHVQVLDARDLAAWLVAAVEARTEGVFNCVGPEAALTMAALLDTCRVVGGADARLVWVEPEALLARGVEPWIDLPLWPSAGFAGFHEVDGRKAFARGLRPRPLAGTVLDVLTWETENVSERRGLTPEREAALLEATGWR
jgi:2'-hydroxyisoflavone reductase